MSFSDSNALLLLSLLSLTNIFQVLLSILTSGAKIKNLLIGNFLAAHLVLAFCTGGYLFYQFPSSVALIGVFFYFYLTAFGDTFWWPFIHPQIPKERVNSFFTRLRVTWATFSFIGVLALKNVTEKLEGETGLVWFIFGVGFVGAFRIIFLLLMKTPTDHCRDKKISFSDVVGVLKSLLKKKELHFIFLFVFFEPLFGPTLILFLNELGISKSDNFLIQATGLLSTVISLVYFNQKLKKVEESIMIQWMKYPVVFFIGLLCLSIFIPQKFVLILCMILIKFLMGLVFAGVHLIYINRLFRTIDSSYRSISMGVMNLLVFSTFFGAEIIFSMMLKIINWLNLAEYKFVMSFSVFFLFSIVLFLKREKPSTVR